MKDRRDEDGGQDGNLDMIIEKQRELRAVVKALGAQVKMNVVAEKKEIHICDNEKGWRC